MDELASYARRRKAPTQGEWQLFQTIARMISAARFLACIAFSAALSCGLAQAHAEPAGRPAAAAQQAKPAVKAQQQGAQKGAQKRQLDRSGRKQVGKASYYAGKFAGRRMADGTPMQPHGNAAASKTLPLGTTARVTNLETGKSAIVTVRDRGPHVRGRIIDLSPATARQIGITREVGVARVEVVPIRVPPAHGPVQSAGTRNSAP